MRIRVFAVMIAALAFCGLASAQGYSIRVAFNTNLRAEHSLESDVVESAPAGSILQVVDSFDRWLKIDRSGREVWMASWVRHTRIAEGGQPAAQPASNVPAQVDNCCFVDRQCTSDQDWENGYWAFQNGQCAAPAQPQAQTPAQPVSNVPAQVDNCCFVDRQCNTPADWENGFYAFRDNQCAAPAQAQSQAYTQSAANASGQIDNCCLVNRQCHSQYDWDQGYYAYQNGQCQAPVNTSASPQPLGLPHTAQTVALSSFVFDNCCFFPNSGCQSSDDFANGHWAFQNHRCVHPSPIPTRPSIEGPGHFVNWVDKSLGLLESHAPEWLNYVYSSGLRSIKMSPRGSGSGFLSRGWHMNFSYADSNNPGDDPYWQPSYDETIGLTGVIVHEACHALQQRTITYNPVGWQNELPCVVAQRDSIAAIDPTHKWVDSMQWHIDNIQDPSTWWW